MIILGALASCGGDSAVTTGLALDDAQAQQDSQFAGLPAIPLDEPAASGLDAKAASWVSSVSPQAPLLAHRTYNCPVTPDCLVLEGLHIMPATFVPPPPHFATLYQVPLGA
jgi:hypothetical protein